VNDPKNYNVAYFEVLISICYFFLLINFITLVFLMSLQVRWVASQTSALKAIKNNLHVITTHLEEAATRKDVYAGTAKTYLKDLSSPYVLKTMFLLLDILTLIKDLSKVFIEYSSVSCKSRRIHYTLTEKCTNSILTYFISSFSRLKTC
jgi:hypothetical protein